MGPYGAQRPTTCGSNDSNHPGFGMPETRGSQFQAQHDLFGWLDFFLGFFAHLCECFAWGEENTDVLTVKNGCCPTDLGRIPNSNY